MRTIANLFRGSPFQPLQTHMKQVNDCVRKMEELYAAFLEQDFNKLDKLAVEVSRLENLADATKNEIRNNLPRGIFLAINRGDLLEILKLQDNIADKAEDIAVLMTLKRLKPLEGLEDDLKAFLDKNLATVNEAYMVVREMNIMLESSFSGKEAKLVEDMVNNVAFLEHEVDIIQARLLKKLFSIGDKLPCTSFYLWINIFKTMASLSNTAENLADRVRMLLELK